LHDLDKEAAAMSDRRFRLKVMLNKSAQNGTPGLGIGCEAQNAGIPGGVASVCNKAKGTPKPERANRVEPVERCLKTLVGLPGALLAAAMLLAGCGSTLNHPPVQDLRTARPTSGDVAGTAPPPGAENAGKPGYYTVQPGDTIRRIAAINNRDWRDIARWNSLDDPNKIEVGQVVRVVPPGADETSGAAQVAVATQTTPSVKAGSPPGATSAVPPAPPVIGADKANFIWPAKGSVLAGFDGDKNKGIDIGGKAGDPIYAAADGRVVYAGSGLPGYGNLVILKHNNTFLTAYAHNRTILVKEDQNVKRGQLIAEMGSTDASRAELHFEIRRSGKPVNPAQYLPNH
jgi:lipoprotein NlpD